MSYLGAGLSLLISYATATLICYAFNKIHGTRLFPLSKFGTVFAMSALFSAAARGLYDSLALRLILVIPPVAMICRALWKMKGSVLESISSESAS